MTTFVGFGPEYFHERNRLVADGAGAILELEERYANFLLQVTLDAASTLDADFRVSGDLLPYWLNYAPRQRGRQPTGESAPWSEVGEKSISFNLIRSVLAHDPSVTFPGLPFGGDVRFATHDALVHFDVKLTGPNDNANEIVASPNQVSGDGARWDDKGVLNSPVEVVGERRTMAFQPELAPFYRLEGRTLPCLTFFLKAVYTVETLGRQPLSYLELVCVPNGLLLFDTRRYSGKPGLLIPGKDTQESVKKRTRVRLDPLATIGRWRSVKIYKEAAGGWASAPR